MKSHSGTIRLALAFAALLAALTLVIWRQSRALETLRAIDQLRGARVLAEAERSELLRNIQTLESRARVVADAQTWLGMHVPSASEIVILPLATPVRTAAGPSAIARASDAELPARRPEAARPSWQKARPQ
jgi:cell division protein FtsL